MIAFRKHGWEYYKNLVCECSNLECHHYTQLEAHHIIPIGAGGLDEFDNIIILCRTCHMRNGYHTDWMLHQDELHKWKDEVDSHIMNELQKKQIIDDGYYYTENGNMSEVEDEDENITNEDLLCENNEEIYQYFYTGIMGKCLDCRKNRIMFKFKNGLYCAECINKYIDSLLVTEFIFKPRIFPNLFKEYDPIKCEINRKEIKRRKFELR